MEECARLHKKMARFRALKCPDLQAKSYEELDLKLDKFLPRKGKYAYRVKHISKDMTTLKQEIAICTDYSKEWARHCNVKRSKPLLKERMRLNITHKKILAEMSIEWPLLRGRSLCINNWLKESYCYMIT